MVCTQTAVAALHKADSSGSETQSKWIKLVGESDFIYEYAESLFQS